MATLQADPTRSLIDALTAQRVFVRQLVALGTFLAGCAAWRISALHDPEPFVSAVLLVGGLAMTLDCGLAWAKHAEVKAWADDLIIGGYVPRGRRSPIERVVAHRRDWVIRPRSRRRLAASLRWRLQLAQGRTRPTPGYVRASGFPALAQSESRVLLEELPLVNRLADRVEADRADPIALVLLWSVVSAPPSLQSPASPEAGEELRRRLQAASRMLGAGASTAV
jgi:hypothetical protein